MAHDYEGPAGMTSDRHRLVPPMPLSCHPALEPYREAVLQWLDSGTTAFQLPIQLPILPGFYEDNLRFRSLMLIRSKAYGLAPHVGDPYVYVWMVATDDVGRRIAGPARVVHTEKSSEPPPPDDPRHRGEQ